MTEKKKPAPAAAPAKKADQVILDTCKKCQYLGKTCDGRLK